jgi:hypothetical protein
MGNSLDLSFLRSAWERTSATLCVALYQVRGMTRSVGTCNEKRNLRPVDYEEII